MLVNNFATLSMSLGLANVNFLICFFVRALHEFKLKYCPHLHFFSCLTRSFHIFGENKVANMGQIAKKEKALHMGLP